MIVYKIQNCLTGDFYVGQTITNLRDRLCIHICDSKKNNYNSILHNSIRKYGSKYFIIGELQKCDSLSELNQKEIYWIDKLKPNLNIQKGGKNKGMHSENSINLMSEKAKNRWKNYSVEKLNNIKENYKKSKNTEEYKNLDIWKDMVKKKGSKIEILDLKTNELITYNSIRECERNGWSRSSITRSIKNQTILRRRDNGKKYKVKYTS
jgi:group I intron endonuclease